jgi:hypothetical protein
MTRDNKEQVDQFSWVERYVRCRTREADGLELDAADAAFVEWVDSVTQVLPGVLEDELLLYGLGGSADMEGAVMADDEQWRVAASTRAGPTTLAELVDQALAAGTDTVPLEKWFAGPLLKVVSNEPIVEVCYHEGLTVLVERADGTAETVGRFGGVYMSGVELQQLHVVYQEDENGRTVRLTRS